MVKTVFFSSKTRMIFAATALPVLAGCSVIEDILDAFQVVSERPRFIFVTNEPIPNQAGENTLHLYSSVVLDTGKALNFNTYMPLEDVELDFLNVEIAPGGQNVALSFNEYFGSMFDTWVHVLSDDLQLEYFASDDIIGTAIRNNCDTSGDEFAQEFAGQVAQGITDGSFPPGSIPFVAWGEGTIFAGGFLGWLSADKFVASITNDPPRFVIIPGEPDPFPLGPGLNNNIIYVTYEKQSSNWDAIECSIDLPAIPARPTPLRDLTLSDGILGLPDGVILLDGAQLLDTSGARISGGYTVLAVDGPLPD